MITPAPAETARIGDVSVAQYEAACERFDRACAAGPLARAEAARIIEAAEAEWEAARDYLDRFELSPGIPLPECDLLRQSPKEF